MTTSDRFAWSSAYATGNALIDEQHRTLLSLASALSDAVSLGKGYQVIDAAYGALAKYTTDHFHDEERLWAHIRNPSGQEHERRHEALADELAALRQEVNGTVVYCTPNELANWMEQRLIPHFVNEDMRTYQKLRPQKKKPG